MTFWLALLALVVVPFGHYVVCSHMRESDIPRPPTVPFFFLFGTVGGWLLAVMLSPSGLAASCMVLLLTVAPIALLTSAIRLAIRPERSVYHRIAMWSGFGYPAALVILYSLLYFVTGFLKDRQ